jgi:hypothetical protein
VATVLGLPGAVGVDAWLSAGKTQLEVREAIATAALPRGDKSKSWFKRVGLGELLGSSVVEDLANIPTTDLAIKLADLEEWAYAG